MMMITTGLPDATAKAARDAGLLTPQALDRLLTDATERQRAADSLRSVADQVSTAGIDPVPMDEVNAEVKAYRAERQYHGRSPMHIAMT